MNKKVIIVAFTAISGLLALVTLGVLSSSKEVVTVRYLLESASPKKSIRLGARVANDQISYVTSPAFKLDFVVKDPADHNPQPSTIAVHYQGIMPDTLKAERDVILEGEFTGKEFIATTLLTQCPSKYVPPTAQ
jgi:cytochrome c-type biogenesis protein CcmE